jgi:1-acyl-sn-glycerol-3-phosphate acyltransferase
VFILKKIWRFFFGLWVWSICFVTMMLGATLAFLVLPVIPFRKSHKWAGGGALGLCVHYTFNRFRIIYDPDLDRDRYSLYLQNHISLMDGHLACRVIPHSFCGLHNHWHFRVPGYGWIMKLANGIPVYPHKSGRTAEITEAARDRINNKKISILAFPEGTRTTTGEVGEFKRGVFFMARDAGIPIVPLAVHNFYPVNHKGQFSFEIGHNVTIYLGKQIETAGLNDDEVRELAVRVRKLMADFVEHGRLPEDSRAVLPDDMQPTAEIQPA